MDSIHRRIARIEAQRPKRVSGPMIEFSCLLPEVQAIWQTVAINQMTLAQLNLLEEDLRRFTE